MPDKRTRFSRVIAYVAMLCVSMLCGCGESDSRRLGRRVVALEDVPEAVMTVAKKDLPDVTFNDAWKNIDKDGNLHSYEIRGQNANGKIREVRIAPNGEILERE